MWLLENLGDVLEGRRLWLRPGKLYLFGRTTSEPGQLAISDKSISRKHLTIRVDNVKEGDGLNRHARTAVTIEDLNTKMGTLVDGVEIRGQKHVLTKDTREIKMGRCDKLFRITWHNVTLSFSFTTRELRDDPWPRYRDQLEQLDIKYIADYDIALTTHVMAKKRNTSKGLQALINGKYIIIESFISALVEAARQGSGGDAEPSPLERDFDGAWPNALEHLPPRGEEPSDRPISTYAPDERRLDVFDGYTFIFYETKQYENLFAPITNGKGKALLREVVAGETQIDDFVRYVKEVAGEKGLGEFEDGSEGKGVVVVRYAPSKGEGMEWFSNFQASVSLRLDQRLINQRDFLDAILAVQPAMLRRPLEEDDSAAQSEPPVQGQNGPTNVTAQSAAMDVDHTPPTGAVADEEQVVEETPPPPPSRLPRGGKTRRMNRFKGFDAGEDPDAITEPAEEAPAATQGSGIFVSQTLPSEAPADEGSHGIRKSQRKRPAPSSTGVGGAVDDMAPSVAAAKRRRIAAGEDPTPPAVQAPEPVEEEEEATNRATATAAAKKVPGPPQKKKGKAQNDILELARQRREEAERRQAEERERLAELPEEGINFDMIRRLTIVEEMEVRRPAASTVTRTRDQDVADGRWDPNWNGRPNFKKFRRQGDLGGRLPQRVIVGLEPAKVKEYGIGDDYWLNDDASGDARKERPERPQQAASQKTGRQAQQALDSMRKTTVASSSRAPLSRIVIDSSDSEQDDAGDDAGQKENDPAAALQSRRRPGLPEPELPRTRAGKEAERGSRNSQLSQRPGKRPAPASPRPAAENPAKKARTAAIINDSDDSDDGPKFRFGRR